MGGQASKPSGASSSAQAAAPPPARTKEEAQRDLDARLADLQQVAQLLKQDDVHRFERDVEGHVELLKREFGVKVDVQGIVRSLDKQLMDSVKLGRTPDLQAYAASLPEGELKQRLTGVLALAGKTAGVNLQETLAPFLRMRARHHYYTFKYVQLNLFVVLYALHVQQLVKVSHERIIAAVVANQQQQDQRLALFMELVKTVGRMEQPDAEHMAQLAALGDATHGRMTSDSQKLVAQLAALEAGDFKRMVSVLVDGNKLSVEQLRDIIAAHSGSSGSGSGRPTF